MSKKTDPHGLVQRCVEALLTQEPNERRITLEYLWARFVQDPAARDREQP